MTERKPAGMSWEAWREEPIRLAREDGAFDNLPGAGKPFTDLGGGYDPDWWVKKLISREKLSILPPALELLRKVEAEVERIWTISSEPAVREKLRSLNGEIGRANARAAGGPPTRLAPLDADAIVAQWRTARKALRATGSGCRSRVGYDSTEVYLNLERAVEDSAPSGTEPC